MIKGEYAVKTNLKESILNQAIHQLSAPVVIINSFHIIQYINKQFSDVCGFSEAELIGQSYNNMHDSTLDYYVSGQKEMHLKTNQGFSLTQLATISHIDDARTNERYTILIFFPCNSCGI